MTCNKMANTTSAIWGGGEVFINSSVYDQAATTLSVDSTSEMVRWL